MQKINNWSNLQTQTYGSFLDIAPGAYVCNVIKVEEQASRTGKSGVTIYYDIAEGPMAGYYRKQYDRDANRPDRKWRGTYWQMTEGKGAAFFKGFITSLEESNSSFQFDWDETKIKNIKVGIVIGREQYKSQTGELRFSTKPRGFCSAEKARSGEIEPPVDKLYKEPQTSDTWSGTSYIPESYNAPALQELADDEELPF